MEGISGSPAQAQTVPEHVQRYQEMLQVAEAMIQGSAAQHRDALSQKITTYKDAAHEGNTPLLNHAVLKDAKLIEERFITSLDRVAFSAWTLSAQSEDGKKRMQAPLSPAMACAFLHLQVMDEPPRVFPLIQGDNVLWIPTEGLEKKNASTPRAIDLLQVTARIVSGGPVDKMISGFMCHAYALEQRKALLKQIDSRRRS